MSLRQRYRDWINCGSTDLQTWELWWTAPLWLPGYLLRRARRR